MAHPVPARTGAPRFASEDIEWNQVERRTLQNVALCSLDEANSKLSSEEQVTGALPEPALNPPAPDAVA